MADTTYVTNVTPVTADTMGDLNRLHYTILGDPADAAAVRTALGINEGYKNRIINGGMQIDQRNAFAAQTIVAGAALAYTADRWYSYCTGANVTGQVVAGSLQSPKRYRFTGAASVTGIRLGQRIEAVNSYDLNNGNATISVDLANSLLTTVTWTLNRATTTDDTFGSIATPTVTQIATGTFTVTSALTRYNIAVAIPAAGTTGLELVLSVGAQTSGTWTIGDVQLEKGSVATSFDYSDYGRGLIMCQRYYEKSYPVGVVPGTASDGPTDGGVFYAVDTASAIGNTAFKAEKRATPTVVVYDALGATGTARNNNTSSNGNVVNPVNITTTAFNRLAGTFTATHQLSAQWTAVTEL